MLANGIFVKHAITVFKIAVVNLQTEYERIFKACFTQQAKPTFKRGGLVSAGF